MIHRIQLLPGQTLSVKSNAALFAAIDAADGGTGDMRLQISKEGATDTASVVFSDSFSGRAEFGLVGADAFKLKVSPDGSAWTEAFTIGQDTGNLTLPRGLSLTGVVSPAQITADQDNYNPAGLAAASVMQINADAARNVSGLASGAEGRCVTVINVGSQPVTLLAESSSSSASNRFSLASNLTIAAKQAAILRYDGTAARWQAIAGAAGVSGSGSVAPPQGRLTLAAGVPVMMSTQSSKTTLYYTPYVGNQIPIYDGANMVPTAFAELSIATTDTIKNPAAIGTNKVNDWFVWNDGGTLRLSHGPDWTNDTTRSAGTALVMVNGIWLNNTAITNGPAASRGTYVGTTRSDGANQLNWIYGGTETPSYMHLFNAYNRKLVCSTVSRLGTWSYSSATVRGSKGDSVAVIYFVFGLPEEAIKVDYLTAFNMGVSNQYCDVGFAMDSTTTYDARAENQNNGGGLTISLSPTLSLGYKPVLGAHFISGNENGDGTNSTLFIGGNKNQLVFTSMM